MNFKHAVDNLKNLGLDKVIVHYCKKSFDYHEDIENSYFISSMNTYIGLYKI